MKNLLATIGAALLIAVLLKLNGIWPRHPDDDSSAAAGTAMVTPAAFPSTGLQERDRYALPELRSDLRSDRVSDYLSDHVSDHVPDLVSDSATSAPFTFMGSPCAGDCTVMLAGYRWAEAHAIVDSESCPGLTDFGTGCRLFADDERDFNR